MRREERRRQFVEEDHFHPILLPDVTDFSEVLEYLGEWDHAEMSHRDGLAPEGRPEPRYLAADGAPARIVEELAEFCGLPPTPDGARNEVGPYCSLDLSQVGGPRHRGLAVRATDRTLEAIAPRVVTPDDHLSFKVIGHRGTECALVVCEHGQIIGSHWLAYIYPESIPVPERVA